MLFKDILTFLGLDYKRLNCNMFKCTYGPLVTIIELLRLTVIGIDRSIRTCLNKLNELTVLGGGKDRQIDPVCANGAFVQI